MATAPVKSQPLHNFSLSFLKWGGTTAAASQHSRCRRPPSADTSEPDSDKNESETDSVRVPRVGSRSARSHRFSFSSCSSLPSKPLNQAYVSDKEIAEKPGKPPSASEKDAAKNSLKQAAVVERIATGEDENEDDEDEEEKVQKPWNLRPRKGVIKNGESKESDVRGGFQEMKQRENLQPKSMRLRGFVESGNWERKEKRKFWISLSREEIEEDIFVMTGSRPSRRPQKRAKNVQKQLDNVFPGLWLVGFTADAYRVADAPIKR